MLSKYPNVIQALKDDNIDNLNAVELKIYSELGRLDDSKLTIIADYYSNISQDNDLFRIDSKSSSQVNDAKSDTNDEQLFSVNIKYIKRWSKYRRYKWNISYKWGSC